MDVNKLGIKLECFCTFLGKYLRPLNTFLQLWFDNQTHFNLLQMSLDFWFLSFLQKPRHDGVSSSSSHEWVV